MREDTVSLIKDIIGAVFKLLVCVIFTAIIVWTVVEKPKDLIAYVSLSLMLFFDGIIISTIIPPPKKKKYKHRTVSRHLVFWLSAVFYCCALAVTVLTYSLFMGITQGGIIAVSVFLCIFGGLGLADLGVLVYQIIGYVRIKLCLKYGVETTAEFVGEGSQFLATSGHPRSRHFSAISGGSVIFKFKDFYGREVQEESKCVYLDEEIEMLEKMGTFKIKYDDRTAVIDEMFEPKDEEQETLDPPEEVQGELSENKGEE